jgi:ubiquinone/menaquinone biosynthesis C-methylase UbiE
MKEKQHTSMIKETFDTIAGDYDCNPLRFFSASAEYIVSLVSLHGNENVLDVATGTGNVALSAASRLSQGSVTAIDFSPGMLQQARKKAALRNIRNVTFIETDMQSMDFTASLFDVAICAFGIFFVDDMDSLLYKIYQRIRPGGRIAICNFAEDYFIPLRDLMMTRLSRFNVQIPPQTWKRIADEAGCRELFNKAGIHDICVKTKNMGYFLSDEREWWDIIWNAGFRGLVSQLDAADLERFRKEHLQEVSSLATRDGMWLDIPVLYTTGVKEI